MNKRGSLRPFQPNAADATLSYCRARAAPVGSCRHYASAYLPHAQRAGLFALYALDNAIFSIPFLVTDPNIVNAKLQWWRNAIDNMFAKKDSEHPILRGLLPYLETPGWRSELFTAYIDHTQRWLTFDIFQTQTDYLQHIHHTCGHIGELALLLCVAPSDKAHQFAKHFATVVDTVHFTTTLDQYIKHNKLPFSLELLDHLAIPADQLLKLDNPSVLVKLIDNQLTFIQSHMQATQTLYDPKTYPNLRYFRVMMQLAHAQLQDYRKGLLKRKGIEKGRTLMPIAKYWITRRTR